MVAALEILSVCILTVIIMFLLSYRRPTVYLGCSAFAILTSNTITSFFHMNNNTYHYWYL